MSDKKKEDESLSAQPQPFPPDEYPEIDVEKLLKYARRLEANEEGTVLLDRNNPRDRLLYGDDE